MSPTHTQRPEDVAATFCATLVDEWIEQGVRHAVVAPGSRSTPLALALAARTELQLHVFHDERSAAFAALGIGLATGVPAILLCTSGTAAAHFHAAIIEAHQSAVPILVCTADRPPELRDVGAPQTIDQTNLYGNAVRWFHDPGVAAAANAHTWRSTAAHAFASATGVWPGPVQLNLPFREPLVGVPGELAQRRGTGSASRPVELTVPAEVVSELAGRCRASTGVIVLGRGCDSPQQVAHLAWRLGWPVLADVRSGLRSTEPGRPPVAITAFDDILRSAAFTGTHVPDVVLRVGEAAASKVLAQWMAALDAFHVHVSGVPTWADPDGVTDVHLMAAPGAFAAALAEQLAAPPERAGAWLSAWLEAEHRAQAAIDATLDGGLSDPAVARLLGRNLPTPSNWVISSSMPIRDAEWYASSVGGARVFANRGANGIDGVIATATGVALATAVPTFVLIGDVAFVHDSSSLTALMRRDIDLRIVVVDNDGGGIFNFLSQATALEADRFEQLFGTPHGTDLATLAAAHGIPVTRACDPAAFTAAIAEPGTRVVLVRSDRIANVGTHEAVHAAVGAALSPLPSNEPS
jgi:2-succinyl-5-enolpyruvyl-6-hydroxy-3-cyclohexene-1-carboxylate synthase